MKERKLVRGFSLLCSHDTFAGQVPIVRREHLQTLRESSVCGHLLGGRCACVVASSGFAHNHHSARVALGGIVGRFPFGSQLGVVQRASPHGAKSHACCRLVIPRERTCLCIPYQKREVCIVVVLRYTVCHTPTILPKLLPCIVSTIAVYEQHIHCDTPSPPHRSRNRARLSCDALSRSSSLRVFSVAKRVQLHFRAIRFQFGWSEVR